MPTLERRYGGRRWLRRLAIGCHRHAGNWRVDCSELQVHHKSSWRADVSLRITPAHAGLAWERAYGLPLARWSPALRLDRARRLEPRKSPEKNDRFFHWVSLQSDPVNVWPRQAARPSCSQQKDPD